MYYKDIRKPEKQGWFCLIQKINMKLIFLGTNGWYDTKTGNTPSILIDTKKFYLILDAGFGIYKVDQFIKKEKPIFLFISHFHLDHICGLHTLPKLKLKQTLQIYGPKGTNKELKNLINHPFFPSIKELNYKVTFSDLEEKTYNLPFKFECKKLQHVDKCLGYRFYLEDKIITYCSDTAVCENDYLLAKDSDILIHECSFLPGQESAWGHTNPEQAAKLAKDAKTKKLLLTHFSGNEYTSFSIRQKAEKNAKKIFKNSIATKDGMIIKL